MHQNVGPWVHSAFSCNADCAARNGDASAPIRIHKKLKLLLFQNIKSPNNLEYHLYGKKLTKIIEKKTILEMIEK